MKTMMSGNRRSSSTPQINHPFLLLIVAIIFLNTGSAFIPSSLRIVSATTTMTTTTTTTGTGGANPTATQTSKPPLLAEVDGGGGGSSNSNDDEDRETSENQDDQPLQLPEATNDPSIPSIKLGESIRFEEMGPVIINADGTTRRIDNWDQMTKSEQEVAWRRIAKRNEERRKALLEEQQQEKQQSEKEG